MKNKYFILFIVIFCALTLWSALADSVLPVARGLINGLTPIALAFFIAYLLDHVVTFYEKLFACTRLGIKIRLTLSIVCGLLSIIGLIGALFAVILPAVVENGAKLISNLPQYADKLNELITEIDKTLSLPEEYSISSVLSSIDQTAIGEELLNMLSSAVSLLSTLSVSLVLSVLILVEKKNIKKALNSLVERVFSNPLKIKTSFFCIKVVLDGYLYGKLVECLITGVLFLVLYIVVGLPYFALFSILIALLYVVPYIGGYVGLIPAVLAGLTVSPTVALVILIAGVIILNVVGTFISPLIYKNSLNISALTIMASIVIGGSLAGIVGFLCAPPVASTIKFLLTSFVRSKNEKTGKTI